MSENVPKMYIVKKYYQTEIILHVYVKQYGSGDGSGLAHSHCCNHKNYGVYEAATSSPGQSPGPAYVPHKMRQAGHHDNLPDQHTVS